MEGLRTCRRGGIHLHSVGLLAQQVDSLGLLCYNTHMLNKKEIKLRKLSNTHAVAINKLMLPLISTLAHIDDENDINTYKMYADDIAHNVSALCVFNTTLDAEVLHDNIMRQDTCPREHFYTVLKYIEDNKLINANLFTCM